MKYRTKLHKRADEILAVITTTSSMMKITEDALAQAIESLQDRYGAEIEGYKIIIKDKEKELIALMKKHTGEVFDGEDRVDLDHGSLLYAIEERVKKARGVLAKLEEFKFEEAIERSAKVNWDVLEKWPVEKLILVGTERKRTEEYTYELEEAKSKEHGARSST